MKLRRLFYTLGRISGDINALRRGTIVKRIYNRIIGRTIVRRMWWR